MHKLSNLIKYLQEFKKEYGNLEVFFSTDDEGNSYRHPLLQFSLADVYDGEIELEPSEEDKDPDDLPFEPTAIVIY